MCLIDEVANRPDTFRFDQIILKHAKERPEKTFIINSDHSTISYKQFNEDCIRLSNALMDRGVGMGSKVSIYMPNAPECITIIYGAPRAAAVTAPINWCLTESELTYCLRKCEVEVCFTAPPYTETVLNAQKLCPDLKYIVELSEKPTPGTISYSEFLNSGSPEITMELPIDENDPVLIVFTSGTTGRPKGVIHTHKSIGSTSWALANYAKFTENDCSYNYTPLYHAAALVYGNHSMALVGGTQYLAEKFSPSNFWEDVRKHNCTYFMGIETVLRLLMQQPEQDDDKDVPIRYLQAALPADLWDAFEERFNCTIVQGYALSENPLTSNTLFDQDLRRRKLKTARGNYSGLPMDPAKKQAIWDEQGNEVPPYTEGEIVFKGAGNMKGYYKEPVETAKTIVNGWLKTGDAGYMDEDGHLYFLDRIKDVVRRSGENISSKEVEAVLMQMPEVELAAVLPVKDHIRMEEVKAYIVLKQGEELTPERIWEYCQGKLADFKIPRYIEFRADLPVTSGTFRVKKAELKKEKEDLAEGCFDRRAK